VKTALLILLAFAVVDLAFFAVLLAYIWVERRRQRQRIAEGAPAPSPASGEFGCLVGCAVVGFVLLYGAAWWILRE
jgi:hypothetical protein